MALNKRCTKCAETKDLSLFSKSARCKDGYNGWCKKCISPAVSQWQKRNKLANRNKLLKNRYGLSPEGYTAMMEAQNNCCAICEKHSGIQSRPLSVDHDHKTGKVRQLLCDLCNTALGCLKDCPEIMEKAANYIRRHNASK